jgi:hypothetical protein
MSTAAGAIGWHVCCEAAPQSVRVALFSHLIKVTLLCINGVALYANHLAR